MWFTIGFSIACGIGAYIFSGVALILLAIVGAIGAVICAVVGRDREYCKTASAVLLGAAIGAICIFCYHELYLSSARINDGKTVFASVEITDYSYKTNRGIAADGVIIIDGREYQTRVYVNDAELLVPGDTVTGEILLRYTGAEGEKEATHHSGKGIFLLAYAKGNIGVVDSSREDSYFASHLRRNIQDIISRVFPEDTAAFAKALLLGDSSDLSYKTDTSFKISGIRHVIAVSGLHVSILFSMIYILSGRRRIITAVLGIPVLLLFAAVAGFTPSVVRACIMQGLMILAMLFNKEYDPPTALAFAVLIMLAVNPMTITSVSFQLSVGCIIGIFLFSGRIHGYLIQRKWFGGGKGRSVKATLARWIAGSVSVSLSAMVVTTPLSAYYFGMVSIVGVLTNLLTLWVISFIFYGIMAAAALSMIWLPLGRLIAGIVSWPIRYVLAVSDVLSSTPFSAVYTNSIYIILWLVFCYLLLIVFLLQKKKSPGVLTACMFVGLCLAVGASWLEPRLDDCRVTVLNVGQGQSILIQGGGKSYLVDCGGDTPAIAADAAAQALLSQGVSRLDGLILTHYDGDHAGGAEYLLQRICVDTLYLPDTSDGNAVRNTLCEQFAEKICWINKSTMLQETAMKISLFSARQQDEGNESSMCILFQVESCDILITGDLSIAGERALIEQTELPVLEILVVGHHGSKTSTGLELLSQTRPASAVISVGADNRFGHPAQEVLDRLMQFGCKVYRTDQEGTIIFRR